MNLKESQEPINFLTVRRFTQLLADNRNALIADVNVLAEITSLKKFLLNLEDSSWAKRAKTASKKLSKMTEEERKMTLMWPDEKEFFLKYKKHHPDNPWGYLKEYQKSIRDEHERSGKIS